MSVLRYDPFRDLGRLTEELLGGTERGVSRSLPMDAYRRGDRFLVHLDLPGVKGDSIELTCEQNVLTVEAERRFRREEGDQLVVSERPQGRFQRQLFLSDALDPERIEARYEDGVLTIEIPVAEQAKPRRIEVSRSEQEPQTIEGSGTRQE
jgi:HSP20 family protein